MNYQRSIIRSGSFMLVIAYQCTAFHSLVYSPGIPFGGFLYLCRQRNRIMEVQNVVPDPQTGDTKKSQVRGMFNRIAPRYDLLNHLLSANIDKRWRKICIELLRPHHPARILDVASGTGDLAIAAAVLQPTEIIATDLSEGMLEIAEQKINASGLEKLIHTKLADGENLPFSDGTFDAVTIGFGIRNFGDVQKGITEFYRVLRPGGVLLILEFSLPSNRLLRAMYLLYFRNILPLAGRLISRDKQAYAYLNRSVEAFPTNDAMIELLKKSGFTNCRVKLLSFGISSIYTAIR
ncbi:MAG: bifunctional demethylmenaquinone methyltransferase/2-methoxy-6-polyprenyl-1,4-benzoquinol methylase UbiE [Bacteroidales bacterium]